MRLGARQLELLRSIGTTSALVVPTARSERLRHLGLLRSDAENGALATITPAGLRALADGVEAGRISLFTPQRRDAAHSQREER